MSDTIDDALARAQANFAPVKKTKTNPHFKSKYAGLDDVLAATIPALNAEGFVFSQPLESDADGTWLVTQLRWKGDVIESRVPFDMHGKPQEIGSALTYYRRYLATTMLGIAADEDDDGNAAQDRPAAPPRPPRGVDRATGEVTHSNAAGDLASDKQQNAIRSMLRPLAADAGCQTDEFWGRLGVGPLAGLSKREASEVIDRLKRISSGEEDYPKATAHAQTEPF